MFEPKIVTKRRRRLSGVDELVISLSAKGLTKSRPVRLIIGTSGPGRSHGWPGAGDCGPVTVARGAKFWLAVLTDLRNRGMRDVFFRVYDGLKGLPEVMENV